MTSCGTHDGAGRVGGGGVRFFWRGVWTEATWPCMVCALCLLAGIAAGATPAGDAGVASVSQQEAEIARQAAEKRAAELGLALVKTERELEKERERYAELYLKSRDLQEQYDRLQLRLASLLLDDAAAPSGQVLANGLAWLEERQAAYVRLAAEVRGFGQYLPTVLETLQPSEVLRREIMDRYRELARACDRVEALPPIVAGRGGEAGAPTSCRVLSANPELGVVVLDAGALSGVRAGSLWRIRDGERVVARVRVIEVRSALSAALVLEGRMSRLAPGLPAEAGE